MKMLMDKAATAIVEAPLELSAQVRKILGVPPDCGLSETQIHSRKGSNEYESVILNNHQ